MCVCLCKVTIYKRSQRLSTSYILYIHSIACLPFEVMMTPYYVKGAYYALLQSLDFFGMVVLEDALILGGSKIILFFTSFALLQYFSPQPDTNGSISSGFDEGHLPKNQMCCDWLAVPECSLDGVSVLPHPCQSKFVNIAISIHTLRILNKRIAQNLCTHGYCKTY